jgi:hypothetical protein
MRDACQKERSMKHIISCVAAAVILTSLLSCQTTQKPAYTRNLPAGFAVSEDGVLVHTHSGGEFPMSIRSFIRGNPYSYDHAGYDVSVGYQLYESGAAAATVYIYPALEIDLKDHFEELKYSIVYFHGDARQKEEFDTSVELEDGSTIVGLCAVYSYQQKYHGRKQKVESQAFVFKRGNWFIAFRITYPEIENRELIRDEAYDLVTQFGYTNVM